MTPKPLTPCRIMALRLVDRLLDRLLIAIGLLVGGFAVSFIAVMTESPVDNTVIPIILVVIASLFLVDIRRTEHDGKAANPGPRPDKLLRPFNLRFAPSMTGFILILFCIGLVGGMVVAKGHYPIYEERELRHNLTGMISPKNPEQFSFIVFGDTRTEVFIPTDKDTLDTKKELQKRYSAAKRSDIHLFPARKGALDSVRINLRGKSLRYLYANGWPTDGYKKTRRTHPDSTWRKIYDHRGHTAVFETIADLVHCEKAQNNPRYVDLAVHTGDIVLWSDKADNVYWARFDSLFYRKLKGQCFTKRFLPVAGNHEYWKDPHLESYFQNFPFLRTDDADEGCHYYALKYGNSCFIFLCSGTYVEEKHRGKKWSYWTCMDASFHEQMAWFQEALEYARDSGCRHLFVTYHKPSHTCSEHPPLDGWCDPRIYLKRFKRDNRNISVTVFGGHNHTTEIFRDDDITYVVAGGGGANQTFRDTTWTTGPDELYWKKRPRRENYNYLRVDVDGGTAKMRLFKWEPMYHSSPTFIEEQLPSEIQVYGACSRCGRCLLRALPLPEVLRRIFWIVFWVVLVVGGGKLTVFIVGCCYGVKGYDPGKGAG
jgi:hypothetical protein